MNYQNDINEIISFIDACIEDENDAFEDVLKRFTQSTSESFLQERAEEVKSQIRTNPALVNAFRKLVTKCDGKSCAGCVVRKYCNKYITEVRANASREKLQMVDLFCGAETTSCIHFCI